MTDINEQQYNLIQKIWYGQLPLSTIYWLYGFGGGFIWALLFAFSRNSQTATIITMVAALPYQIVLNVGVWRAANLYTKRKLWATLAKVATTFGTAILISNLLTSGLHTTNADLIPTLLGSSDEHVLNNCMKCDHGKCEPHTVIRSITVKLSEPNNSMLITAVDWTKDKSGNFETETLFDSKEKGLLDNTIPSCAIKSNNEGFCKSGIDNYRHDNYIFHTQHSFNYKDNKMIFTIHMDMFNAITQESYPHTDETTHECS